MVNVELWNVILSNNSAVTWSISNSTKFYEFYEMTEWAVDVFWSNIMYPLEILFEPKNQEGT